LVFHTTAASLGIAVADIADMEMPMLRHCELEILMKMASAMFIIESCPDTILRDLAFTQSPSMKRIDITFLTVSRVDKVAAGGERNKLSRIVGAIQHPWAGPNTKVYGWLQSEQAGKLISKPLDDA
jgi:hypothetical protein